MGVWEDGVAEDYELGRQSSGVLDGFVYDAVDAADARSVALTATPSVYYGMLRTRLSMHRVTTDGAGGTQGDFHVNVHYGLDSIPEENEIRFSCSTKGGRERITQALSTFDSVGFDPNNGDPIIPAADTGNAIGVDEEGNVTGVEVVVPKTVFSLEIHVDFALLDDAYFDLLEIATGTVNNATFYGRPEHSVMFLGIDFDGAIRIADETTQTGRLRFDFARSAPAIYDPAVPGSGIEIPGLERPISKRGWDYLDIRYGEFVDSSAKTKVRRPVMAWARQTQPEFDFSQFGIGS